MPYRTPRLRPPRALWTWVDDLPLVTAVAILVASSAALAWILA